MSNIRFKVMTFNLRMANPHDPFLWEQRRNWAIQFINQYQPDLIGTQEAKDPMYEWLKEHLGNNYDSYGVNRNPYNDAGEHSALFVLKNKYQMLNTKSFMLSETPDVIGSMGWDGACERICSYADIALKGESTPVLRFFNTHLDHVGQVARTEGLRLILNTMNKENQKKTLPTILTGDFNDTIDSGLFDVLHQFDPLTICYDILSPEEQENIKTFHGFKGGIKGQPIDYILCSSKIAIQSTRILHDSYEGGYPSDHYPVMSEIEITI